MTELLPVEIRAFTSLMEVVASPTGEDAPAIRMLCQKLSAIVPLQQATAPRVLFEHVSAIDRLIDEHMTTPGSRRAGQRLKDRIARLFEANELAKRYVQYQTDQRENVLAILDLIPLLDDVKFDGGKLLEARSGIVSALDDLLSEVGGSRDVSDPSKKLVLAQVEMIKRTLERFETDGVVPFRDSIYCTIGRLTLELRDVRDNEKDGIRKIIDDLVRVKEMAEIAAGTLKLAGPFIAGYLSAPT